METACTQWVLSDWLGIIFLSHLERLLLANRFAITKKLNIQRRPHISRRLCTYVVNYMYAASWRLGSHIDLDFICVSGYSPVLSANSRKRQYLNVRSSFGGLAADPPTQAGASSRKTIASSSQFLSKDQKYHPFKNKGKSKTDLSATYVQCFQFEDFQRKS